MRQQALQQQRHKLLHTTATTQATAAATSATNAATSATNASTAQTAAETAQTAAEAAQTAAEAAQEAIDGFFLGAQSSNPTVDLNGNAVTAGDWYFNTTDNTTRIYDGSAWQTINPDLVGDSTPQLGGTLDANGNNIDMGTNVITDTKVGQWDTAFGWGNHASAGYLTSFTETNDLTAAVTWANVPDANITQSSVTQHQAALSITESQISDLQSYLTGNQTITLSGAVTGSGTTSITTTLSTIDGGTY
jgi:multidrug efflux pump subunit AcrA (membrane-fusion protein)